MLDWLSQFSPVMQAFMATMFTWAVTALGASLVFFFKKINQNTLNAMLGFAAGVMTAASFWSLLAPGIEMAGELGQIPWLTAAIGFLGGGFFLLLVDKLLPHLHPGMKTEDNEKAPVRAPFLSPVPSLIIKEFAGFLYLSSSI